MTSYNQARRAAVVLAALIAEDEKRHLDIPAARLALVRNNVAARKAASEYAEAAGGVFRTHGVAPNAEGHFVASAASCPTFEKLAADLSAIAETDAGIAWYKIAYKDVEAAQISAGILSDLAELGILEIG